uniref:DH domain-containing protein n=1 Tax=Acrobeloides nanus TaxID=290746 RepID=A0A914BVI3_9BILA
MEIAGSRNRDEVISFLKQRLTWISTRIGAYKIVPSGSSEKTYPSLEWLYTLKYSLIYRIASMKELLPKPNLAVVVYPPDLRAKIPSTHFCHWVHIYASANENLAMKEYLQITCEKDISLDNVETQFSSRELSHIDTFDKLPSLPTCLFSDQKAQQKNISEERLYKSVVELVQTEEAFVTDLDKLINQYILPANLSFLEATEKLQKTHAGFLSSLRDAAGDLLMPSNAFAPLNYAQIKDAVMRISALFINKCNSFKVYSEYSAAYLRFQHLQSEDPLIKRRLSELNLSGQQRESIQSMLIKPIQRVLKYPLFLEQIRENCVKDSIEQKQCAQSLTRMQTLATYVNEMQRIYEEYGDELDQLAKSHNLRLDLRDLFMFAHLKWLNADEKYVDCVAFVFTNFIILLSESKKKVKPHRILPIWEIEINEVENTDTEPSTQHVFTIIHMNGREDFVYQIACCHPEIKMYFIKSVKKALRAYMRLKPRPISGSSQSDGGYGSGH